MDNVVELNRGFGVYSDEIRECLELLGISQRAAARYLELNERDFRGWCAGRPCPRFVILALEYLVTQKEAGNWEIGEDATAGDWLRRSQDGEE